MKLIHNILRKAGYKIEKCLPDEQNSSVGYPPDFTQEDIRVIRKVKQYTMTSDERIWALIRAVEYIVKNQIPGDIVECGVWRGGSMMAAIMALQTMGVNDRNLHLFDTFQGMTEPREIDLSFRGEAASDLLQKHCKDERAAIWAYAPLEKVMANLIALGYDDKKIHFVKGRIEDTIPDNAPQSISLLRLDTDWYESTFHELTHLYPRLSAGGVLIIDDYGHWQGARKATDEYILKNNLKILLNRIDYTGRIAIKQ